MTHRWGTGRPRHSSGSLRWACLERDRFVCQGCGYEGRPDGRDLFADHIRNLARGGARVLENMQTLCSPCHDVKSRAEAADGSRRRAAKRRRLPIHPADLLK